MSGSWFEKFLRPHKGPWHHQVLKWKRRRRGSLKSWPLTEAVITFALNMPKCSCAVGGIIFRGGGWRGWINQLCLLWGLFITQNLSLHKLPFQKHRGPRVPLSYEERISLNCICLWERLRLRLENHTESTNCLNVRNEKKKMFYPLERYPADPSNFEPLHSAPCI